ncbi:hypothetical protein WJX74_005623 [Apatococcus lobatus]|uniref:SHSP domain-containing protein n=1 Tax=Apatococcus lobatus TaxID=904363 RepID=A0AAW1RIE2_9CHLO
MEFRTQTLEAISPVVMVVASPEAEAICQSQNGLTVTDLLRPYGFFHHLSVPVRTVGEHSYRIKELRLRFYEASAIYQPAPKVAEDHLCAVLSNAATDVSHAPDLLAALKKGEVPDALPWFKHYREEYMRMLRFSEHETFDHPVACLLVLSASEPNVVQAAEEMFQTMTLPPALRDSSSQATLLRHHVLLADDRPQPATSPDEKLPEGKLAEMKEGLGDAACSLVRINSGDKDKRSGLAGLWHSQIRSPVEGGGAGEPASKPAMPEQGYGAALSVSDVDGLKRSLEDFAVRALIPHLEMRVRNLSQQVALTRKGFKNQIKTLLWRNRSATSAAILSSATSNGADVPATPLRTPRATTTGVFSGLSGSQAQLRQLADTAFLVQDFQTAASTLRTLAVDYRSEGLWHSYASVQELLGLASFMIGASMQEVMTHFKEAFHRFSPQERDPSRDGIRYATRSMLLLAQYASLHGQWSEAHQGLMRAHLQEEDGRAAVLLEQAALCLLHKQPPNLRRFSFHFVLAGLRYNSCNLRNLGRHAYRQVVWLYEGRHWAFIEEHLHDVLGKQSKAAGDLHGAVRHFLAMLPCPRSSPSWQSFYLRQFLDAATQLAANSPEELGPLDLPLPAVNIRNPQVFYDNQTCHANGAARAVPAAYWRRLESLLLPGGDAGQNWLDSGSKTNLASLHNEVCVAGEAVTVAVQLSNPLGIPLVISRLSILAQLQQPEEQEGADGSILAEEVEVTLAAGEAREVRLQLRPLVPGTLTLRGITWTLSDIARGERLFKLKAASGRRATRDQSRQAKLVFKVIPSAPLLQVELLGLPRTVAEGALVEGQLRLSSRGGSVSGIRMLSAEPDLLLDPSAQPDGVHEASAAARDQTAQAESTASIGLPQANVPCKGQAFMSSWGPDFCVDGQSGPCSWPMRFHPRQPGRCLLHLLWYFEPRAGEDLRFRMLRMVHEVEVLPSLCCQAQLIPAPDDLQSYLLRLQVDSRQEAESTQLEELVCRSPGWKLEPLASAASPSLSDPAASAHSPPSSANSSTEVHGAHSSLLQQSPDCSIAQLQQPLPAKLQALLYFRLHPPLHPTPDQSKPDLGQQADAAARFHLQGQQMRHAKAQAVFEKQQAGQPKSKHKPQQDPVGAEQKQHASGSTPPAAAAAAIAPDPSQRWAGGAPDLSLHWHLSSQHLHGCHHLYKCWPKGEAGVQMLLKGPAQVQHDFAAQPLCRVRLQLSLRNFLSGDVTAEATFGAAASDAARASWSTPGPASSDLPACHSHVWSGRKRAHIDTLPSGAINHKTTEVLLSSEGMHNLQDYQVKVKDGLLLISGTRGLNDAFPDFTGKRQQLRQERQEFNFHREIRLPADASTASGHVHAKVVEGVLEVTVDKVWGPQASDRVDVQF